MELKFSQAIASRVQDAVKLMEEFYAIEHLPYDEQVARKGLRELMSDPRLGALFLMETGAELAGYIVVTFGFSLEFHGRAALVDELYVREQFRGRGFGKAALAFVENHCRGQEVAAVHLEVDRSNFRAQELYRKAGYKDHDRYLLTKWI